MLVVNNQISIPLREFAFTFSRSSGPGGQNVNKVNSKVMLKWPLTESSLRADVKQRFQARYPRRINHANELLITSQRFRDQGRNVADCLSKLRELILAVSTAPRKRKATKPTRASHRRRIQEKRHQGDKKRLRRRPNSDD
jgi:ribosome-associated protein